MLSIPATICISEPLPTGPLSSRPFFSPLFFVCVFWRRSSRHKSPVYRSDAEVNVAKDFIKAFSRCYSRSASPGAGLRTQG